MENWTNLALLVPVAAVVAIAAYSVVRMRRALRYRRGAWARFADRHGYAFDARALRLAGRWQGLALAVFLEERDSGESSHKVVVLRLELGQEFPGELLMRRERRFLRLFRKDDQVGSEDLDAAFEITGLSAAVSDWVKRPPVRAALLNLVERYPDMFISNGVLHLETNEVPVSEADLEAFVGDATSLAAKLDPPRT